MMLTSRDIRLVKDVCLSAVLSRSQIITLGYFSSAGRCNRRLKQLSGGGFLRSFPISDGQFTYFPGKKAKSIVGEKIASVVGSRKPAPSHVCHAMATTDIRIALAGSGYTQWRFEAQLRQTFAWGGVQYEVRPDGLAVSPSRILFIEADLSNVSIQRYARKLAVYSLYFRSGVFSDSYSYSALHLLTVVPGADRKRRIASLPAPLISHEVSTYEEMGISVQGAML